MRVLAFLGLVLPLAAAASSPVPNVVPDTIPSAVTDRQVTPLPAHVELNGWLGQRVSQSAINRLARLDPATLLDGYRNRPGQHTWDGEHVSKWLHAATLAWADTGDATLRARLDTVVTELVKCQLADGYLGTYAPDSRWTSWDVWSHKYNLIGLITYVRHTGNLQPLEACRRMADLLCTTFGEGADQRTIIHSGWHSGMASSSVLEPMVLLYRLTGDTRYLDFCHYILRAWEQPDGPKIISRLLGGAGVNTIGNAKAYEMLSCLNGVLELYRTTGDERLLTACLNAWSDIRENRLYLTGAASSRELFRDDHELPNAFNTGETCVTVTWLQLNAQLLRLTGEARFAQELERVVLNQLLAAQSPSCEAWGYYVQLEGRKNHSSSLTGHCCLSSGPRGLAMTPSFAFSSDADGVVVNLYDAGTARLHLADRTAVSLTLESQYPTSGNIRIMVAPESAREFTVKLRIPGWSTRTSLRVNGASHAPGVGRDGYVALLRTWQVGDLIELELEMSVRAEVGTHLNAGKVALLFGPLVFAADQALLPDTIGNLNQFVLPTANIRGLRARLEPTPESIRAWSTSHSLRVDGGYRETTGSHTAIKPTSLALIPFAEAGGAGSRYKVWLPLASSLDGNVLLEGIPSASGTIKSDDLSAINDGDFSSVARLRAEGSSDNHWFAVALDRPALIRRVVFSHGMSLAKNGWFDASKGKPTLEALLERDGPWVAIGSFGDYPATTATDGAELLAGQREGIDVSVIETLRLGQAQAQSLLLETPVEVFAVRVVGTPSQGSTAGSASLAIADLQAFAR